METKKQHAPLERSLAADQPATVQSAKKMAHFQDADRGQGAMRRQTTAVNDQIDVGGFFSDGPQYGLLLLVQLKFDGMPDTPLVVETGRFEQRTELLQDIIHGLDESSAVTQ